MEYGDLLFVDNIEDYYLLPLSVFHTILYINHHTSFKGYLFKTDSDCNINYGNLLSVINQGYPYMGSCNTKGKYIHKQNHKHFVPKDLVGSGYRPPFATGGGYLVQTDLIPRIVIALRHIKYITHMEDENIGRALNLINISCHSIDNWIARHGCKENMNCSRYVIIHPS